MFITLLSLTTYLRAQEICNNGIDDDGDGLVDIFDPDCTDNVGNEYFYFGQPVPTCREKPPVLDKYTLELKYRSETGYGLDQRCGVFVGDLDGDGVPELVGKDGAKNSGTNNIRVFNGIDGTHLVSYNSTNHHYSQVVIANLGTAQSYQGCIFFVDGSAKVVRLDYTKTDNGDGTFSHALTQGAISTQSAHSSEASPQIADFDMDGSPEIYVGNYIYDAATLSYYGGDASHNQGCNNVNDAWAFAYDVFKSGDVIPGTSNTFGPEADGLELIAGNKIYTVDLTAAPANVLQEAVVVDIDGFTNPLTSDNADGFTSIGDVDNNGKIDVIVSAAEGDPMVYVYDPYTAQQLGTSFVVRSGSVGSKSSARAGRCNVADFDNDGFVEIGLAGLHTYVVIEYNQSLNTLETKWRKDGDGSNDGTQIYDASQMTGSTLFDFEGDGNAEVVYSDEHNLYIWRGSDGTELAKVTSGSGTRTDYPLVADADDDGQAEIIISAQSNAGSGNSGGDDYIAVYRSKDAPWVAARETWNQHGYIVTNVGADLIIPQTQQEIVLPVEGVNYNFLEKYNQAFNGFLVQTTFLTQDAEPTFAVGDLTTENVTINVDECVSVKEITFTVTLENNGDWKTPRNTPIAVFDGDPYEELATYLGTFYTSQNVEVGSSIDETYTVTDPNADGDLDLYVLANHYEESLAVGETLSATLEKNNSPTLECNYVNNVGFIVSIRNCEITNAPQIDLDRDNSEGTDGRDYTVAFAIKESADDVLIPVAISDTDNLIADEDGATIQSASIVLTNRPDGSFESISHPNEGATVGGITITKEASGDITLTGSGTLAEYENIIKAITYQNTKLTGINQENRIINVTVEDPDGNSSNTAVATILLKVKPNLDLDSDDSSVTGRDYVSSFTENTAGTALGDVDVIINSDGSIDLQSVTFELTNPLDASKDLLQVNGSLPAGISVSIEYENGINILELSGAASAADYQTAIHQVEYLNTSDNPTSTDRIIEVKVNDGFLESLVAQTSISIVPVNDAPVIEGPATAVEYQIADPAVSMMSNADISDADDLNMVSAKIEITSNFESGADVLSETYTGALVIDDATPGELNISGDASISEYETLLNSLTFVTTGSVGVREISITVNDGDDNSLVYNRTIVVGTAANDAPVAADDNYIVDEGVELNISAALGLMRNDEDFDIGVIPGEEITVTAVDAATHGTLVWSADGSFVYTQSGDGSLGAGESLVETLNYTITDDGGLTDSGVLTITINGVNNDPVANDDDHNVDENASITVNAASGLIANDTDVNTPNDVLLVQTVEGTSTGNNVGTYGTLVWSALGDFTYTPDNSNPLVSQLVAGESVVETFSYTMHDGNGGTASATLSLTIDGENDAPIISATDLSLEEGVTDVQIVTATDEDANETKEFSVSGIDADDFDIDPSTGELTFKNTTDYENPTDDDSNNIYNITVTVKDKSGLTDSKDIAISVTNIIDALTVQFTAASYTDAENTGGDIPVVTAGGEVLPVDVTVNATITGGTASLTDDYTFTTLVTIPAGDYTTPKNIALSLAIVDETLAENDETITFELSGQSAGVSLGAQTTTTYTIQNDDTPSVTLSLADSPIIENGGVATITATTDILSVHDIVVNLINTGTATIISDYTMAGSITIPAGQTQASVPLTAVQDALDENNETVITDISTVTNGAENGTQQVATTIIDDDNAPNATLSVNNASIAENGGVATVTAEIDAPSALPVTVTLAYSGTASLGGTDATTAAGSNANSATEIVIPAGSTSGTVTITAVQDALDEDDETVIVDIASVDNAIEASAQQVTTTIIDDDNAPNVTLSVNNASIAENGGVATVTAEIDAPSALPVTVTLAYSGTASLGGTDATTAAGSNANSATEIVIPAGSTSGTVTITAVQDALDEDDETVIVDIASVDNAIEASAQQVTTTITDDDNAPNVTLSVNNASIAENGGVATVTAEIDAPSALPVTVTLAYSGTASLGGTDATTAAGSNANSATEIVIPAGSTSGTVTITAVADLVYEGNETVIVDIASVINATEASAQQVTTTITDAQAQPTVTLELTGSPFSENGGTATIKAVLSHASVQEVLVDVNLSGSAVGTDYNNTSLNLSIPALSTSASITLTGLNDIEAEGDETIIADITNVVNASEDGDQQVIAIISDDDVAGLTITATDGSNETSENGTTDSFEVVLNTQPASDVTITITGLDATEGELSASSLTFTNADWDKGQTVTITGMDDKLIDGSIDYVLTLTVDDANSDDAYDGLSTTASVRNLDNDVADFIVSKNSLSTSENGTTDNFTIVLTAEPVSNVVLLLSESDDEGTVQASVTFTPSNWDEAQVITVTPEDDNLVDGEQSYDITISVDAANSDDDFDLIASKTVSVINADNDTAGLSVTLSGGSTETSENGTTDSFDVVLNTQPSSDVVINISGLDATEGSLDVSTLTFTPANWNDVQTVTVTGQDDAEVDGDINYTLTLTVDDAGSDDSYDGLSETVSVINSDNDTAGLSVTLSGGSTETSENGTMDSFDVVLNTQPASDVVINISGLDATEGSLDVSTLTFTLTNWNDVQTVTVTGQDDAEVDGDINYTLTLTVDDAGSDDSYDGLSETVSVINADNDTAGLSVTLSGGSTETSENGTTDSFDVVLNTQPASDVVINISGLDATEGSLDVSTLTFTPANWNDVQTVTVTGQDDAEVDGDINYTLTLTVDDAGSDDSYDGLSETVSVINADNDTAGLSVTLSGGSTETSENGTTDSFDVVLNTQPASDVVINISGLDETEGSLDVSTLTFTPANWNEVQTVTVTGQDDAEVDGDINYTLTLTVDDAGSDDSYHGLSETVSVINADNDTAGLSVTLSGGSTETSENGTTDSFDVVLNTQPASDVVINISGLDATEGSLDVSTLTFTPANWNEVQTVTVTGQDDAEVDGDINYTLTLTVDDAGSDDSYDGLSETVAVTNLDNDTDNAAPIALDDEVTIEEGEVLNGTTVLENDSDPDNNTLTVNITPVVNVTNGELVLNSDGTFTYTPDYRFYGTDSFTYEVCDNGTPQECATAVVTITVTENTDRDGDGIDNDREGDDDLDGDGIPNDEDEDSDGDGILDEDEGDVDTDGDGTPDYKDLDSDDDGILDEDEGDEDTDGDGIEDFRDDDSDGDGILDVDEGDVDTDGDGLEDYIDLDSDNDGVLDADESDGDCDNDGTPNRIDEDRCYEELEVLEGFSPNGDGVNDTFVIGWVKQFNKVSFEVFNRWGNVVYRKDKYENDWNGISNVGFSIGDELPVGTYYYIITIQDTGEKIQGNIYLNK